jgi:large subunit ribosomal protein L31
MILRIKEQTMKTDLHPKYNENIKITCSCGNVIIAGSTQEKIKTEICSACHPFYTGQQKLVDTAGRVDKFMARKRRAEEIKTKKTKKTDEDLDELMEHEEVETEAEKQEEITPEETVAESTEEKPKKKVAAKKTAKKPKIKKAAAKKTPSKKTK